ncbi:hypothetical protein DUNSADRAFT_8898 [Dunaliella salina]|uniref:Uncharacterized protein n=1 Tax=Dunaliella salina TaxID=3046 RepID=A0ABQ7GIL3_DUNSA|nr:hypothetical protein DUNSADRAFT_8898 [Dunaliella salina]|eukprot:KAF5834435.1 hypothetical protein DUNSADRAFT_8898 [Dunaliella salina]
MALEQELMLLGTAREMHCAAALCRLMDWREASLSAQALAPLALEGKVLLAFSGKDELLPAPLLASWALNHVPGPPQVHLFPSLGHADILSHGPTQDKLVMEIIEMAYGTLQPRGPSESSSL